MNPVKRKQIYKILARAHGNPSTELNFRSNFELLVSVILSAQATDISVNKATSKLYRKANT
ncbi:MAG TPA: endonuclease III, partial [Gammaproteobacteria bacterium]|nr:endonuclease III [Gammaproteobacteria bacterium]